MRRRRAVLLMTVVVTLAFAGAMVAVLASYSARSYWLLLEDRAAVAARAIADSCVAYVDHHRESWSVERPAGPIEVDIEALLPPGFSGSARLSFDRAAGRDVCRVSISIRRREASATDQFEVDLG